MSTSLEHLAAVAAAGVPGLAPVAVGPSPDDDADFRSAVVVDATGRHWRVRSPLSPEASVRLETEHLVLRSFTPAVRSRLPFLVPTAAGCVAHGDLHAFVHSHIEGAPLDIDALARMAAEPDPEHHRHVPSADPPPTLAVQLGRLLAAIHALPPALVLDADLPGYTAEQCRLRRLTELRRAADTQRVPAALLHRWERVLTDRAVWRFQPRVVHGDLQEDDLVISRGRVRGVTGWTDLHVGDPAEDFAWLFAARDARLAEGVLEAYAAACRRTSFQAPDREPDPHLLDRARLDAELALAQWLVRGVDRGAQDLVADAEQMLATLEQDVAPRPGAAPGAAVPEGSPEPPVQTGAPERPDPAGAPEGPAGRTPQAGPEDPA
ncbi:phosphotransferase [Kocuria sp. M4R2S49]|uniref:phosphotransferase n=1 Tax=Kocuria rhizosphaericola TaxID=3376284 RepID=UPI0037B2E002